MSVTTDRAAADPAATGTGSGALDTAVAFMGYLNEHNPGAALRLLAPGTAFEVVPAGTQGTVGNEGRAFIDGVVTAFPDLQVRLRSQSGTAGWAVVEVTMEGTQAADFLGADNQEKHVDVDQAWLFRATDGEVTSIRAYWCQNQLYRRLGVKRLDQISIAQSRKA